MMKAPDEHLPFSNSAISAPLRTRMDADPTGEKIAIIVTLRESDANQADPGGAVQRPKEQVKAFLKGLGYDTQESDFYVFAELPPADIEKLAGQIESVFQIWPDEEVRKHI